MGFWTMNNELIYLNGIDGVTGQYLIPPLTAAEATASARGKPQDRALAGWLGRIRDVLRRPFLGLPIEVDPRDVPRAGWGIIYASGTSPEVRSALEPLIAHRRRHVPPDRCKVLEYRPGEAMKGWLGRHGVHSGVAPTKVPYYLTLIGDPTSIPFEFQYLLDIEYAVGRLAFDRPDQYRQYAESVVDYETSAAVSTAREVVYWGTRHTADRATQMSADCLITPLHRGIPDDDGQEGEPPIAETSAYRSRCLVGRDATKANLAEVLHARGDAPRPVMLFTASHGMGWPPVQHPREGAEQAVHHARDNRVAAQ
jgi:hypothetical protein